MEQITLYFRQGSSDKVYQAGIVPQDGGYAVQFAYGRRGTTLQTGTKTQAPVPLEEAKAIYESLIKEKTAKGYTPGEDGTTYQHIDKQNQSTGIQCQLLNPVEEDQAEKLVEDPAYWMQEKFNGRWLLIQKQGNSIIGINRLGLTAGLPQTVLASASNGSGDFILDGEAI
jgi:bifunctional non-homologous end joining protein LigD